MPAKPVMHKGSRQCEESVDYLRRLKGAAEEVPPGDVAARAGEAALEALNNPVWKERRQSPRLRCSGSAELRTGASDARMWGTLTDVSLHGCYVEMNTTFPVGTKVDLVLKSFGIRIETPGTVRVSYPFLGMGASFAEVEPVHQLQLQ